MLHLTCFAWNWMGMWASSCEFSSLASRPLASYSIGLLVLVVQFNVVCVFVYLYGQFDANVEAQVDVDVDGIPSSSTVFRQTALCVFLCVCLLGSFIEQHTRTHFLIEIATTTTTKCVCVCCVLVAAMPMPIPMANSARNSESTLIPMPISMVSKRNFPFWPAQIAIAIYGCSKWKWKLNCTWSCHC